MITNPFINPLLEGSPYIIPCNAFKTRDDFHKKSRQQAFRDIQLNKPNGRFRKDLQKRPLSEGRKNLDYCC